MSKKKQERSAFDLIVIGAGSAGLSVAAGAVQLGYKTALIEKNKMGGDCLNTGCVPSKALLAAAKHVKTIENAKQFGIKAEKAEIDFSAVKDHVQRAIKTIEPNDSVERFQGLGVNVIEGEAQFIDDHNINVEDRIISGKFIVIAAGSRAAVPPIEGLDKTKVLTNETIFGLRDAPKHLMIIGGGPIGIEMAQAHARLGVDVTVLTNGNILAKDDPEFVDIIRKQLISDGVRIEEDSKIIRVQHSDKSTTIKFDQDGTSKTIHGSHIMVATGRTPNIENLGLENTGVYFDKKGVEVDAKLKTSQRHIFAAGDIVAGAPQFTHIAGYHAGVIIKNMIFKLPSKVDYRALPWVTYTDPELAHVGMTETMAREEYDDTIKTVEWEFEENDRAITELATAGKIKVVTDKRGRILGASIVGHNAGELINLWGLAISQKLKISAVANMIVPYPTFSEISKRAASSYYTSSLFSDKTRKIVGLFKKLPF